MSRRDSLFSRFAALLLAALLLCPASGMAEPAENTGTAAPASPVSAEQVPGGNDQPVEPAFDPLAGLKFRPPSGFAELGSDSALFQESAASAVRHGRLLKLYLPQHLERQYRAGSPDAVTRQVLVCTLEGQTRPLAEADTELLARAIEGLFVGFARIPRSRTDTPAQEEQNRAQALASSLKSGRPLLADSLRTNSAFLHTCLVHYDMSGKNAKKAGSRAFLPGALAVAAVPVKETMLFITVSSLLGQDEAEPHLTWVKETASAFADDIVRANKAKK